MAGTIVGEALVVYADYAAAFSAFEQLNEIRRGVLIDGNLAGPHAGGAGVFATYPAFDGVLGNVLSEFLGTAAPSFWAKSTREASGTDPPTAEAHLNALTIA